MTSPFPAPGHSPPRLHIFMRLFIPSYGVCLHLPVSGVPQVTEASLLMERKGKDGFKKQKIKQNLPTNQKLEDLCESYIIPVSSQSGVP